MRRLIVLFIGLLGLLALLFPWDQSDSAAVGQVVFANGGDVAKRRIYCRWSRKIHLLTPLLS